MKNEIINYESYITWDNGNPVIAYKEMLTKEVVAELPLAALSARYERTDEEKVLGEALDFEGLTLAEVMNIRLARSAANGELDAIKTILDRTLGKPKQSIQSTKLSMTYTEYLDQLAQKEDEDILEAQVNAL